MKFFYVLYRSVGTCPWWFAEMNSVRNTYQSYPTMYQVKETAEARAKELAKDSAYETKVVEIDLPLV